MCSVVFCVLLIHYVFKCFQQPEEIDQTEAGKLKVLRSKGIYLHHKGKSLR